MHLLKHFSQVLHLLRPIMRLNNAPGRKLHRLNRLLARAHRRPHNRQRLANQQPRRRRLHRHNVAFRDPHTHHTPTEAQQVSRLAVRIVVRSAHNNGVRAVPTRQRGYRVDERLGAVDGDEVLRARLEHNVLFARVVDPDDAVADAARGELHGEMAQAAACAHDDNPVAGLGVGFAERGVDGYAGAEERRGGSGVQSVWDGRDIVSWREDVLLECAWGVVSADFLIAWSVCICFGIVFSLYTTEDWGCRYITYPTEAISIHASSASLTRLANPSHPLNSHTVPNLDRCIVRPGAHLHNFANALVTTHLSCLCREG